MATSSLSEYLVNGVVLREEKAIILPQDCVSKNIFSSPDSECPQISDTEVILQYIFLEKNEPVKQSSDCGGTYLRVMMEDIDHKTLENEAVGQLTAFLSTETMPWDSIGVSSKNITPNAGQCSEEHVLKCTFKACDPEQRGEVSVFRIIEYLQEMTGQTCEDWRFQSLYKRLDPEERGVAVDFSTFHAVMKDWIADCRQEGEDAVDLTNSVKDLQQGNKQLAVQNIKLQRTIEAAEELNSRLSEEISDLKGKLRGTQQALEQARVTANELEDQKVFSKSLEEENSKLYIQARQLEKEQQYLSFRVDKLQEENKKLILEKESSKCKIKDLFIKKAKMKSQLSEYENLISCKDAALNEKAKRTEEMTVTLDEYRMVVQELKLEVNRLQEHFCQSYQDLDMLQRDSLENMKICLQASGQPLCLEIEESQKEFDEEADLPSPLCGVLKSLVTDPVATMDIGSLVEQELGQSEADGTKLLLQRTHSWPHLNLMTDSAPILKNQECNHQQQHLPSEMVGSMEEQKQGSLASKHIDNNKMVGVTQKNNEMRTCSSNVEIQAACSAFPEMTTFSSAESDSGTASQEQALVPVYGELVPTIRKKPDENSFEILLQRFLDAPFGCLLLFILQKLVLLGVLTFVSLLAMFCLVLPFNQHPVWIEPKGSSWSQLQLWYLRPPPI
ncbi:protein KASH5 isoform X2 [Rhineura floridana]|uniref:protein KASH5 isoform X2 n=1 Tax=Rhineura floridana TaxID=261503 RepID=UPI002AC84F63|nr:protein KASH5 isoform X2 [Rhineura floridana]